MKSKGFTLIELLAVIVILAIIALIATPIILNIIEDAKEESAERSAENYLEAVELAVAKANLNGEFNPNSCNIQANGYIKCGDYEPIKVEVDGEVPEELTGSKITFNEGKVTGGNFKISGINFVIEEGTLKKGTQTTTPTVTKACTLDDVDKDKIADVGEVVTCTLSESTDKFYVIEETPLTASSINVLTEKNINTTTYRQSENAGSVAFSSTNYWESTVSSYPSEVYDDNSLVKPVVDNYVSYLNTKLTGTTGRLLTLNQIKSLGCDDSLKKCSNALEWVYSTNYWTGSASRDSDIWLVVSWSDAGDDFRDFDYNYYDAGVRPVITISTNDIG